MDGVDRTGSVRPRLSQDDQNVLTRANEVRAEEILSLTGTISRPFSTGASRQLTAAKVSLTLPDKKTVNGIKKLSIDALDLTSPNLKDRDKNAGPVRKKPRLS